MVWGGARRASLRAQSSFNLPSQSAAASSKIRLAGLWAMRALSGRQMNSAWAPKLKPDEPNTSSPTANSVTAGPMATTSPASSLPRIGCRGRRTPEIRRLRSMTAGTALAVGLAGVHITPRDRDGAHLDEDLVILGLGPRDVRDAQHLRGAVAV